MRQIFTIALALAISASGTLSGAISCGLSDLCCTNSSEAKNTRSCCGETIPLSSEDAPQNDPCQCHLDSENDFTPADEIVLPSQNTIILTADIHQANFMLPQNRVSVLHSRGPPGPPRPLYLIHKQFLI